jgi:hypothetical protein
MTVSPQNELSYLGVIAQNPANTIKASRAPVSTAGGDYQFPVGTQWIDTVGLASYILVNVLGTTGTWLPAGGAAGIVATVNGLAPVLGNIVVAGTASQITATSAGHTVTLSTPAAFVGPGSVRATTTLTATLGAITATNGNLVLGTAGNKILSTSVGVGAAAGANSFGTCTLIAGTLTVSTTAVTAASLILLTRQSVGATGANPLGILSVGTIVAGASFDINAWSAANATALAATDVSIIGWQIIN